MNLKESVKNIKFEKMNATQVTVCVICFVLSLCFTIQVRTINTNESNALRLKTENELRDEIVQWKEVYEASTQKIDDLKNGI